MGLRRFISNFLFSRRMKKERMAYDRLTIKKSASLNLKGIQFLNSEFSTDGKFILTYGDVVCIWTADRQVDGKVVTHEFRNNFKPLFEIYNAQFRHPDCSQIMTSSNFVEEWSYEQEKVQNKVCLWSVDGTLLHVFAEHKYRIFSSFSRDGKLLMTITEGRRTKLDIFSVETFKLIQSMEGKTMRYASFSYDSKKILIQQNHRIIILSLSNDPKSRYLTTIDHYGTTSNSKLSPDGQFILTSQMENSVDLYCASGRLIYQFTTGKATDFIRSICFSPDSRFIAVGYRNGAIRIWSTYNGELINFFDPLYGVVPYNPVASITFNKDVTMFVACYDYSDGKPTVWGIKTGRLIALLENNGEKVSSVQFSPDGKLILSTKGIACIWRIDDSRIYP